MSRFRFALFASSIAATLGSAGCGEIYPNAPIGYVDGDRLSKELADKPNLQNAVRKQLVNLFGPDTQHIKVPAGSSLKHGGLRLANYIQEGKGDRTHLKRLNFPVPDPATGKATPRRQDGGYALYRKHCLHCHGVSGAGNGPTADFLYPRPRDYRPGWYKFTSTPNGVKPTREDLSKTILYGLHGTSMPAFEALMTRDEIDQVIDYVIFLSARGETELALVEEAAAADEADPEAISDATGLEIAQAVFGKWTAAETQVMDPPIGRVAPTRDSVLRGRELFLGLNTTGNKVECAGCHGPQGKGNGKSFIDERVFNDVVFSRLPADEAIANLFRAQAEANTAAAGHHGDGKAEHHAKPADPKGLETFLKDNGEVTQYFRDKRGLMAGMKEADFRATLEKDPGSVASAALLLAPSLADAEFRPFLRSNLELWKQSVDDWGNPLRAANLNKGVYKGGRRPLDIYWRLAKGINAAKMPAHYPSIPPERIWDLVNFVLAVPYDATLLLKPAAEPVKPVPAEVAQARH